MSKSVKRKPKSPRDNRSLDDLLDAIQVEEINSELAIEMDNRAMLGWWLVTRESGVIAYFTVEADAFRFRLDYINRILNP